MTRDGLGHTEEQEGDEEGGESGTRGGPVSGGRKKEKRRRLKGPRDVDSDRPVEIPPGRVCKPSYVTYTAVRYCFSLRNVGAQEGSGGVVGVGPDKVGRGGSEGAPLCMISRLVPCT